MLEASGISVEAEVASGEEAVQRARELSPDVVLMDVRMPDMDGLAATAAIKRESPGTGVVILSAYANEDYVRRALEAGAVGYVLKDKPDEHVVTALRMAMNGESVIDSGLLGAVCGDELPKSLSRLTPREREVFDLVARGLTNREIAHKLAFSESTIKNTVRAAFGKMGISDRTQAVLLASRLGLLPD
jgi:DNA-binding NarL/FixJ family response regulator